MLVVGELDDFVALARDFRVHVRAVVGADHHDAVVRFDALAQLRHVERRKAAGVLDGGAPNR